MRHDTLSAEHPGRSPERSAPTLGEDARRQLGQRLRSVYERLCDGEPLPTDHVDLLLRLRHKERDRQRAGLA